MNYVLYNEADEIIHTYTADPGEQFCLTIKLMRKKIATVGENYFFINKSTNFEDSLMAALEMGVITTAEFDSVLGFKEIWDPKKNFWEKNRIWFQTFGSLGGVILPPPFGLAPMLSIMVIEAIYQVRKGDNASRAHNVCRM